MNTVVINLFGAPSVGKSTVAAEIFAKLKASDESCELVREYVKIWAWENKPITPLDQIYLLGQQVRSEAMLYGKVKYIVTDSPILLVGAYQQLFFGGNYIEAAAKAVINEAQEKYNVKYLNFLLPRVTEYATDGRYHSLEDANKVENFLPNYLESYIMVDVPANKRADFIIKELYGY